MVASDNITLFIHTQATISIAVIGETNIQTLLYHELLQALNVSRSSIVIDIRTVGLCIDDVGVSTQRIEHRLSDVPACTVGAVQTNLHALEGVDAQADQVAHVAVTACHIVHGAADMLTVGKGQFRPVLVKHMKLAVDVVLHQQQGLLRHFLTVAVDQLDTVVIIGVVAGRDHDAAIKVIHASDVSHTGRSSDMQQVSVCSGGGQSCHQTILEHIGAAAGVLTDNDTGRLVVAVALAHCVIIPAKEAANLVGVVSGQRDSRLTTEAVSSKILSHYSFSSSKE